MALILRPARIFFAGFAAHGIGLTLSIWITAYHVLGVTKLSLPPSLCVIAGGQKCSRPACEVSMMPVVPDLAIH
jgi:hypothetical protein